MGAVVNIHDSSFTKLMLRPGLPIFYGDFTELETESLSELQAQMGQEAPEVANFEIGEQVDADLILFPYSTQSATEIERRGLSAANLNEDVVQKSTVLRAGACIAVSLGMVCLVGNALSSITLMHPLLAALFVIAGASFGAMSLVKG